MKFILIAFAIFFSTSGRAACDYTIERPENKPFVIKNGSTSLKLSSHYRSHNHSVECYGSRLYWIKRVFGDGDSFRDSLILQKSLTSKEEEIFSCPGINFRASESGNRIALSCGGEVAIKDTVTNELYKIVPKRAPILPDVFKQSPLENGPSLIGYYGDKLYLGKSPMGGWSELCVYTWPQPETKCGRLPFDGSKNHTFDPSGQYALYSTRNFDYEGPDDEELEPMQIFAFELQSKKTVVLGTYKKLVTIFEWPSDQSVKAVLKDGYGPHYNKNVVVLKWDLKDIKAKLNASGKVWSEPKRP